MDVIRLCSELIKIRSENPPGRTDDIIRYIRDFTDSIGIKTKTIKKAGARWNLISSQMRGNLLLCGHVDVVPAKPDGWRFDPYDGMCAEGFVWGRGATDMKGGCASLLWACKSVVGKEGELPCDICFVCDEETGGNYGIRSLLDKGLLSPCDCLVAEPTPALHPNIGQKGLLRMEYQFSGEPGHGSLHPVKGVSAVMEACALLRYLGELHMQEFDPGPELQLLVDRSADVLENIFGVTDVRKILTHVMFNPGRIEGGEKPNIVASECSLELELRVPWGCEIEWLTEMLQKHAPRGNASCNSVSRPSITSPYEKIVAVTCREISRLYPGDVFPIIQWAASDARHLRNSGFSVVEYGPGEISTLHAVDERVRCAELENAARIYEGIILAYS
jgi:succinyl-diaminopimelate desuccinylase